MDLILIVLRGVVAFWGSKQLDVTGVRTQTGTAAFAVGLAILAIGLVVFGIAFVGGFVQGYNAAR
jgi:hypothetical protein